MALLSATCEPAPRRECRLSACGVYVRSWELPWTWALPSGQVKEGRGCTQRPEGKCREASQTLPPNCRVEGADGAEAQVRRVSRSRSTKESKHLPSALFAGCLGERGLWTGIDYLSRRTRSKGIQPQRARRVGPDTRDTGLIHSFLPHAVSEHLPRLRPRDGSVRAAGKAPAL